jgi:hypothetical protein
MVCLPVNYSSTREAEAVWAQGQSELHIKTLSQKANQNNQSKDIYQTVSLKRKFHKFINSKESGNGFVIKYI